MSHQLRTIQLSRILALALAATGTLSCSTDESFRGEVLRSTHFEYHYRKGDETVCPAVLETLERHLSVMAGVLDFSNLPHVRYWKYRDLSDFKANGPCTERASGCAFPSNAYTAVPFYQHELVHAYTFAQWGRSVGILSEGIAVALACQTIVPAQMVFGGGDWRALLHLYVTDTSTDYLFVGRFVAYLVTSGGVDKFKRLYQSVGDGSSEHDFELAFTEVYGRTVDDVWREAGNFHQPCLSHWACAGAVATTPTLEVGETCAGDNAQVVSLYPTGTMVDVEGKNLMLLSCSQAPVPTVLHGGDSALPALRLNATSRNWLEPGDSAQAALAPYGAGAEHAPVREVQWSEAPADWVSPQCQGVGRVTLPEDRQTTISLRWSSSERFVRLSSGSKRFRLFIEGTLAPVTGTHCDSCDEAATCVPFARNSTTEADLLIGGTSVLRVDPIQGWQGQFAQLIFIPRD